MAPSPAGLVSGCNSKAGSDRPSSLTSSEAKTGPVNGRGHCNGTSLTTAGPPASGTTAGVIPPPPRSGSCASRHMAAEQRRRARINERLEALREIVPHSARANTAAFLTEVYDYIASLHRALNKRSDAGSCTKEGDKHSDSEPDGEDAGSPGKAVPASSSGERAPGVMPTTPHGEQSTIVPGLDLSLGVGDYSSPSESPRGEQARGETKLGAKPVGLPTSGSPGRAPGRSGAFSAYVSSTKGPGTPGSNQMVFGWKQDCLDEAHGENGEGNAGDAWIPVVEGDVHVKGEVHGEGPKLADASSSRSADPGQNHQAPEDHPTSEDGNKALPSLRECYALRPHESLPHLPFCGAPLLMQAPPDVGEGVKMQPFNHASSPTAAAAAAAAISASTPGSMAAAHPGYMSGLSPHGPSTGLAPTFVPLSRSSGSSAGRKRKESASTMAQQQQGQQQEEQGASSSSVAVATSQGAGSMVGPGGGPVSLAAGPSPGGYPMMVPMLPPMHPVAMAAAAAAAADAAAAAAVQQWNMAAAVAQAQAQAAVQAHAQAQALVSAVAASSAAAAASAAAGAAPLPVPVSLPLPPPGTLRASSPPLPQLVHHPHGVLPQGGPTPNPIGTSSMAPAVRAPNPAAAPAQAPKRRRRNNQEGKEAGSGSCNQSQKVVRPIAVRPRP